MRADSPGPDLQIGMGLPPLIICKPDRRCQGVEVVTARSPFVELERRRPREALMLQAKSIPLAPQAYSSLIRPNLSFPTLST